MKPTTIRGSAVVAERDARGVLDTCAYVDLALIDPAGLPRTPELTAISLAELHQGVGMAKDPVERARRTERLGDAVNAFPAPLPFGAEAAARYGTLVALALAGRRDPRPRKLDLMIAAIASANGLPLYTRNIKDFKGLESVLTVVAV
ncbi:type II toxin-antitoxin system VapC family toxin [Streptomyces sp. NPDC002790]|uniref:type II toxin-antitoxin system VapC family toxin n=1 Tax=Streptomyces sp. NPDC002790 TaxID=3154431 RepID=UPI0033166333